mgnify:CR=1
MSKFHMFNRKKSSISTNGDNSYSYGTLQKDKKKLWLKNIVNVSIVHVGIGYLMLLKITWKTLLTFLLCMWFSLVINARQYNSINFHSSYTLTTCPLMYLCFMFYVLLGLNFLKFPLVTICSSYFSLVSIIWHCSGPCVTY